MLYAVQSNFNTLSVLNVKEIMHYRVNLGTKDAGSLNVKIFTLSNKEIKTPLVGYSLGHVRATHCWLNGISGQPTDVLVKSLITSSPAICTCYYTSCSLSQLLRSEAL